MAVGDYQLRYRGMQERRGANAQELRAVVDVSRNGEGLGTMEPGKNRYFAEQQVSNESAIRSDRLTGEDLFLVADQIDEDGTLYLKALVKPLVNVIWIAGFVFLGGAAIALWPDAREQRRLALRYGARESLAQA
jgi:cytochrome c-type biogenesis protein CcmF